MRTHAFAATGTTWALVGDEDAPLEEAARRVREAEATLSRFRPDSALSGLNRARTWEDPLLADVTREALRYRDLTGGAFDPTLGAALAGLGYDRPFDRIDAPAARVRDERPVVHVDGDRVTLEGPGELDLGGVAKGFLVDRVAAWLVERGVTRALVDGGGDLRAIGGPWAVGVGDGDAVTLRGDAVATSSTRVRRWRTADGGEAHHVLDPRTGAPALGPFDTAVVRAPDARGADVLATALLVDPDAVLRRLPALAARALVRTRDGAWWSTPDWEHPS